MAQQKFLVTGATGDTGGYTVEQLLKEIPSPSSICVKSPSIIRTVSSPGRMI